MGNAAFSTKGCVDNFKEEYFEKLVESLNHEDFQQELRNHIESGKESSSKWLEDEVAKLDTVRDKFPDKYRDKYSKMVENMKDKQNDQNNKMFEKVLDGFNFEEIIKNDRDKLESRFNDFINRIVLGHSDPGFPKELATLIYIFSLKRNIILIKLLQKSYFEKKILQGLRGITKGKINQMKKVEGFQNNDEGIDFYKILLILVLIILILHICGDLKF